MQAGKNPAYERIYCLAQNERLAGHHVKKAPKEFFVMDKNIFILKVLPLEDHVFDNLVDDKRKDIKETDDTRSSLLFSTLTTTIVTGFPVFHQDNLFSVIVVAADYKASGKYDDNLIKGLILNSTLGKEVGLPANEFKLAYQVIVYSKSTRFGLFSKFLIVESSNIFSGFWVFQLLIALEAILVWISFPAEDMDNKSVIFKIHRNLASSPIHGYKEKFYSERKYKSFGERQNRKRNQQKNAPALSVHMSLRRISYVRIHSYNKKLC
uniref:Uncharacterized protein n=1 Tax=Glossina brevipalpis TaxID=37001 RepID=A0A1A9WIW2_9MUSC